MKSTIIGILAALVFWGGAFLLIKSGENPNESSEENVYMTGGRQIVEITAKGGYFPNNSIAKADTSTTLRVKTNGSFDCSSSLVIPDINYRGNLPISGSTDIEIPSQPSGTTLNGFCAMGMYNFTIDFE